MSNTSTHQGSLLAHGPATAQLILGPKRATLFALDANAEEGGQHASPKTSCLAPLSCLVDAMSVPAFLLDGVGALVHANEAGEALLVEEDGLQRSRSSMHRLVAHHASDDRALCRTIRVAMMGAPESDPLPADVIQIGRPSGRPSLRLVVRRLPSGKSSCEMAEQTRVLLQVIGAVEFAPLKVNAMRRAFGMTRAEGRVASLIAADLSAPQVARVLKVSEATVRSHLKHCFSKAEVPTKVGLARLFAEMPASKLLA